MHYSNNDFHNTYQSATQKLLRRENAYRTNVTTPPYKSTLIFNLINILDRHEPDEWPGNCSAILNISPNRNTKRTELKFSLLGAYYTTYCTNWKMWRNTICFQNSLWCYSCVKYFRRRKYKRHSRLGFNVNVNWTTVVSMLMLSGPQWC